MNYSRRYAHMPVCIVGGSYWIIGKLHFCETHLLQNKLALLQFPFVRNPPDLINGNYLNAREMKKWETIVLRDGHLSLGRKIIGKMILECIYI